MNYYYLIIDNNSLFSYLMLDINKNNLFEMSESKRRLRKQDEDKDEDEG
jgi:hypothetical protein